MPLKTEPGGQDINMNPDENTTNPPPAQEAASATDSTDATDLQVTPATPPVEANTAPPVEEENTPGPTTDPVAGPTTSDTTGSKEARIQQLVAAGFVQDGEYYDKPGTEFAIHTDDIMNDSDEDWATHIAAIESFDSTPAVTPEVDTPIPADQTPAADQAPEAPADPVSEPTVDPASNVDNAPVVDPLAPVDPTADPTADPNAASDTEVDPDAPVNETPVVPPLDLTNKIQLSHNEGDVVDKDEAIEAVQTSSVLPYYKQILVDMITNDALDGLYADYLRRILKARSAGGSYAGTL